MDCFSLDYGRLWHRPDSISRLHDPLFFFPPPFYLKDSPRGANQRTFQNFNLRLFTSVSLDRISFNI